MHRPTAVAIGRGISAAPAPKPARNGAGRFFCTTEQDRLWLQQLLQQTASVITHSHTHAAVWLNRHDVGGQKGQMGIFANVTLACYRPDASEGAEFGAKRTACRSGRRVRLG